MKITGTLNGQPCTIELPDTAQIPRLALTREETAKALGVSPRTVWRIKSLGKLRATSYGVYPVAEIERHLKEEAEACGKVTPAAGNTFAKAAALAATREARLSVNCPDNS